ncbi:MAG: MarR family transcriptional regulator [Peptoniphilus sp.]|uniref:MarR family winged helix-turn-helix transcriptional regulator n=1 Tax=Peptoniphilus sp. TaxID=1971214 RepID=UPI0025FFB2D4|nr:MarR family transcriptional regulator [Peptoniphilus sp.]MCI5642700.1 MarR family transcriptional regulator [Peptoniphilus sp.]MDY3903226.1 MarR family transcriptional regulator [Peptoniphilus sp.]
MDLKVALIDLQCEMVAERNLVNPKQITWLQYDILYQLKKEERILPSKLSVVLGISRTKISKALKGLKLKGYIQQLPNQSDGRELYTSITEEGEILLDDISLKHTALHQRALNVFSKEEQEAFTYLSNKLSRELRMSRLKADE